MTRRADVQDAALRVLAEHGMGGLTHRAVDAEAGIAQGSTSYYFRSRAALVSGCLERMVQLDLVDVPEPEVSDLDTLADLLTAFCMQVSGPQRARTLARYELSLESTRSPELRAELVSWGDLLRAAGARMLSGLGAPDPRRASEELAATIDGLVLTALVRGPDDPAERREWFSAALRRVLPGYLGAQPGARSGTLPDRPT